MNRNPSEGDIISSTLFAYGYYSYDKKIILVDGKTKSYPVHYSKSESERVKEAAKTGKIPPKDYVKDLGAYDLSRASARFVVTSAIMTGGGTGHGPHDIYPDGLRIRAKRLDKKQETIEFFLSGCFTNKLDKKDLQYVGQYDFFTKKVK